MTDPNRTSVGDVPAPLSHAPIVEPTEETVKDLMTRLATEAERAAVVKYLRDGAEGIKSPIVKSTFLIIADAIEKGEHV